MVAEAQAPEAFLTALLRRPGGTQDLREIQARALLSLYQHGGLFAPIGVGEGKTLIAFLAPAVIGAERPLLLVPSSVYPQTTQMFARYSEHWALPRLDILTYGLLSRESGEDRLFEVAPDLLICDEAHFLRNIYAARTRRVVRYMREHPETRFVALSGTMTNQSIRDYAHLLEYCIRNAYFLPRDRYLFDSWSRVLDSRELPQRQDFYATAKLTPEADRVKVREAFARKLRSTPGVVASDPGRLGTSLRISRFKPTFYSQAVYKAVADTGTRPDGALLPDAASKWRCLRQVALGFFYRWEWPNGIDAGWVLAHNAWSRAVNGELLVHAAPGYETEHQVYRAVGQLAPEQRRQSRLGLAWGDWTEAMERPGPTTVATWLESETLKGIVAQFKEPTIYWYWSQAVADELERQGLVVVRAGERPPVFDAAIPDRLALSLAHATGWNLQRYSRSVVLEPPANGQLWEQLIGRTHRQGQEADTVWIYVPDHVGLYRDALTKATKDARYVEQTKGVSQRLCSADYTEGEEET